MDIITLYTIIYYLSMILPLAGYLYLHISQKEKLSIQVNIFFIVYILFIALMIGLRPIGDGGFNDTQMYINWFYDSQKGIIYKQDIGFDIFRYIIAKIGDMRAFFVISTLLSFVLLYYNSVRLMQKKWAMLFFGFMISLFFWNHQVFTIRQGLASMLFLAGLVNKDWKNRVIFFIFAISFHKSLLIFVLCSLVVSWIKDLKWYLFLWILFLIISPFLGDILRIVLIDFKENRVVQYYFEALWKGNGGNAIRWDFVIYSFIFILLGLYNRQNVMKDNYFYHQILNFYIFSNAIILLIAPFVEGHLHRFSYGSIFVVPILVFFPMAKQNHTYLRYIIYFSFYYTIILAYISYKLINQGGSYL